MMIGVDRRKDESDKNYFEGTGYARIPTQSNAANPFFTQIIQTTVDSGLLFFAENQVTYITSIKYYIKYIHLFEKFAGNWVVLNNYWI